MLKDITERKRAEQQLRRLSRVVEQSPVAILITEIDGTIEYINPKFIQLTGYTPEELRGRNTHSLVADAAPNGEAQTFSQWDAIREGGEWRGELPVQKKNGERLWGSVSISSILDAHGVVTNYLAVIEDITLRKGLEAELRQARVTAEAANVAKSEFLANMSHEIRTPMSAIIGMTGLLLDMPLTPEQSEFIQTIQTSGDNLLTLINDILDFSKIESGKLDLEMIPFDLASCIENTLALFSAQVEQKGLELGYLLDQHTPHTIVGDPGRLRQILTNLVGNAVKFTKQGEVVVEVDSRPEPQDGAPIVGARRHHLHFSVRDTGAGISAEGMGRLFRSFSQVDASIARTHGGTGLGLAISRDLSELMGGQMWAESQPGVGSTFHFTIQAQAAPAAYRLPRAETNHLAGKRVLLVNDQRVSLEVLIRQLRNLQIEPVAVTSGAEAQALLEAGESFDLAILDSQMPETEGQALVARLRRQPHGADLPLVMLSSVGASAAKAKELKLSAILAKPVQQTDLQRVLSEIFAQQPARAAASGFDNALAQRLPLRILLAEDHLMNQKVVVHTLARLGYRADVAANGVEVLQALRRQPYDVVLMDVQMPEMDGLEATAHIRAEWSPEQRPYIIALTAHALTGDAEMCLAAGMDSYISKPIKIDKLVAALETAAQSAAKSRLPTLA